MPIYVPTPVFIFYIYLLKIKYFFKITIGELEYWAFSETTILWLILRL